MVLIYHDNYLLGRYVCKNLPIIVLKVLKVLKQNTPPKPALQATFEGDPRPEWYAYASGMVCLCVWNGMLMRLEWYAYASRKVCFRVWKGMLSRLERYALIP